MSLGFSSLINEIEGEMSIEYWPGAINWADEKYNNEWSNALNRFDCALSEALKTKNWNLAKYEGDRYKSTILRLLRKYKEEKKMNDTQSFLESLKTS